jgi:hypothetical protein
VWITVGAAGGPTPDRRGGLAGRFGAKV